VLDAVNWRKLRLRCGQVAKAKPVLTVGDRLLRIREISYDILPQDYQTLEHAHTFYELVIVLDGEVRYCGGEADQRLAPGSVLFFSPQVRHSWHPIDGPCERFTATFSLEPSIAILLPDRWPISHRLIDEVEQLIRELLEEDKRELFVISSRITAIIGQALAIFVSKTMPGRQGVRKLDLVSEVEQLLKNDLSHRLTLDEIAAHFGICTRHLTRIFHQASGISIATFLRRVRLNHARSLLRESDEKVADISARVGIPNQGYFYRSFRQYFGMTPDEYRQIAKGNEV